MKNRHKPWKNRHQTVKKSAPKIHHFFTVSFSPFTSSWFLRIYFPKITVTVTVLKFGWITITVTVLAPAVAPSFPSTPNYRLESHWINFLKITVTVTVLKCFWIRKVIISNMTVNSFWISEQIQIQTKITLELISRYVADADSCSLQSLEGGGGRDSRTKWI